MKDSVIHLGLAGLGTVGSGLVKIIQENNDWIVRRLGKTLKVKTIMVRDLDKPRNVVPSPETTLTTSIGPRSAKKRQTLSSVSSDPRTQPPPCR